MAEERHAHGKPFLQIRIKYIVEIPDDFIDTRFIAVLLGVGYWV